MGSVLSTWRGTEEGRDRNNWTQVQPPNVHNPTESDTEDEGADSDADSTVIPWHSNKFKTLSTKQEKVKKRLQCPICLEICIPPIFMCDTGHHICGTCKKRLKKCPYCSSEYRGTRNFFLENYFEENCCFSFPCPSAEEGCKEILTGKDLKDHHEKCAFRSLSCNSCNCKELGKDTFIPISEYLNHLINIHHAVYWDGQNGEFTIGMSWPPDFQDLPGIFTQAPGKTFTFSLWVPHLVKFHGFTFVIENFIREFTLGSWVRIFGNKNDANQFRVQLLVESKTDAPNISKSSSVRYEGPVFPIQPGSVSVMDHAACLLTSVDYIKSICMPTTTAGTNSGLVWTIKCKLIRNETVAVAAAE